MDFERTTIIGMGADAAFARLADPLLVASYVPLVAHAGSDAEEADLRDWIRVLHPRSWAPREFVRMPSLPLLPNGKVDRQGIRAEQ